MQMQLQLPPQRLAQPYGFAVALGDPQHPHTAAPAAAAVGGSNNYAFPARRSSQSFVPDVFDPSAQQFHSQAQYDAAAAQHFQPRGSVGSLSGYSSTSSPYTSSSNMPTTPTGLEHAPVVNPWFIPYPMGGLPVGAHPMQYWLNKAAGSRQRTNQACEKCRDRKTKCSGDRPTCHRCSIRGLQCEYASEHRIRGPAKNRKRQAASVDLTKTGRGRPVSPSLSVPDTAYQRTASEGESSVSPVDTAPTIEESWNKTGHDNGLFDQWIEQNGSILGLSIHGDAKQDDLTYTDVVDPAIMQPSPSVQRFSASMPHLRMDYTPFPRDSLPEALPLPAAVHQIPVADAQLEQTANYGWSQHFDHSTDFPQQMHYHSRPETLSGPNEVVENTLPLAAPHSNATYAPQQSFSFSRAPHAQVGRESPVPVPSSEGYWFALSAKVPHPIPEESKVDTHAKYEAVSSKSPEELSPPDATDVDSNASEEAFGDDEDGSK